MIDAPTSIVASSITPPASKAISIAHAVTIAAAFLFQVVGVYAAWVTFGAWITLALYVVGGLTVLLQHIVARRRTTPCSLGE
jgi:hypothetical protein